MRESSQSTIELKGISGRGLELVIQIIYMSATMVRCRSRRDLRELIAAATHLQCLIAIEYCQRVIFRQLTIKNFNYFIRIARLYEMNKILKLIDLFIVRNFEKIIINNSLIIHKFVISFFNSSLFKTF
jgi:hypothetical protein